VLCYVGVQGCDTRRPQGARARLRAGTLLQAALTRVVSQYAVVCCNGNTELAALELRRQLRDHVVFERCALRAPAAPGPRRGLRGAGSVTVPCHIPYTP